VPIGSSAAFATKQSGQVSVAVEGIGHRALVAECHSFFEEELGWLRAFAVAGRTPKPIPAASVDLRGVGAVAALTAGKNFLVVETNGAILALRWSDRTRRFASLRSSTVPGSPRDATFDENSGNLFVVGYERESHLPSIARVAVSAAGEPQEPVAAATPVPGLKNPRVACDTAHRILYAYDAYAGALWTFDILGTGALRPRGGKTFLPSGSFQVILPARSN
jgi:hypothetical protein